MGKEGDKLDLGVEPGVVSGDELNAALREYCDRVCSGRAERLRAEMDQLRLELMVTGRQQVVLDKE